MARTPTGFVSFALLAVVAATAVFAEEIAPHDPFATDNGDRAFLPPSRRHPFGTDNIRRDVFSGVVHGARTSATVVFWVVVLAALIGITVGVVSGFRGGIVDDLFMRTAEMFQVVPRFFLALLVISFWGPGIGKLILLLGLTSWPFLARIVRAEVIRLKSREFVEAARAVGAGSTRIIGRHLLPNLTAPVIIVVALFGSRVIMIEAGLAFLGLGDPNRISWGSLANNAQEYLSLAWWMAVFPGLAIVVAVLGLNLLADAINDALDQEG